MRKIQVYSIFAVAICLAVIIFWKYTNQPIDGNDIDGIHNLIESHELFEGSLTEIVDIYDYGNYRFVAALSDNRPSIIEFRIDDNGNYKWRSCQVANSSGLEIFPMSIFNEEAHQIIVSIYSRGVEVQDYSFEANADIYNVTFDNGNKNVNWTILKTSSDGRYSFKWYKPEED